MVPLSFADVRCAARGGHDVADRDSTGLRRSCRRRATWVVAATVLWVAVLESAASSSWWPAISAGCCRRPAQSADVGPTGFVTW